MRDEKKALLQLIGPFSSKHREAACPAGAPNFSKKSARHTKLRLSLQES